MLHAYLDESVTNEKPPTLCIAGVFYTRKGLTRLDHAWRRELREAGVAAFHAVDCAHLRGEFEGRDRGFANQVYKNLIALVIQHGSGSAGVFSVGEDRTDPFHGHEWGFSPYTACAYACMEKIRDIAAKQLGHREVHFIIEAGHEKDGDLLTLLEKRRAKDGWPGIHYQFQSKGLRPLETADILAYEYAKRVKDRDKRNPRISLLKLLDIGGAGTGCNKIAWLVKPMLDQIQQLWTFKPLKRKPPSTMT
jgi:hypothetical protein